MDFLLSETDTTQVEEGGSKFGRYILNNGIKVPLQMFLFAFVPIPFLYCVNIIFTSALVGLVLYLPLLPQLSGKIGIFQIFMGMAPHFVFEMLGFCVVAAVLFPINQVICAKLYRRKKEFIGPSFFDALKIAGINYVFVAFPLLIVAAGIEAYLTPIILALYN